MTSSQWTSNETNPDAGSSINDTSTTTGTGSSSACSNSESSRRSNIRRRSYADWITRAIQSAPDQKMTLAAIYNWMATNVPGLYEKRNLHSSKGWKNAVRHTLSVNRRFIKCSQPNRRAALWSVVPHDESSSAVQQSVGNSNQSTIGESASSSLFIDPIAVHTATTFSISQSIPASSSTFLHSTTALSPTLTLSQAHHDPIVTQTLELHQQDGTVRTVTVPKPFPIHVVGEYRLVAIEPTPTPNAVTSG